MSRISLLIAATAILSACGSSPSCSTVDAQGIVTALRPEESLRSMLLMVATRTQTGQIVANRDGAASEEKIETAVNAAVERHREEWEQNLVAGWAAISEDELANACSALAARDEATFQRIANPVGSAVRERNEAVLRKAGVEVLAEIYGAG